jgi:hypothetical protein
LQTIFSREKNDWSQSSRNAASSIGRDCAWDCVGQGLWAPTRQQPPPRPRYAAHSAKLMQQLARDRKFGGAAARAFAADEIHA